MLCWKNPKRRPSLKQLIPRAIIARAGLVPASLLRADFLLAVLGALLLCLPVLAQEKVAEGEYHMRAQQGGGKTAMDHWILYTRKQGGYRLESEVISAAGSGVIVIQTEELNDQFSPLAINIRLYTHEDTKKPFSTLSCRLGAEQISCKASGQELELASSVDQKGPIVFAVTSLEHIDLMWMMAGAINRAQFEDGHANVPTLVLQDGEDGPELAQTGEDVLRAQGAEILEIGAAKVPVRRYSFENSKFKCLLAGPGLLLKMENEEGAIIELEKFKQYKKLIPELP